MEEPVTQLTQKPTSTNIQYMVSIVAIVTISIVASVFAPEQTASILSFSGAVLVSLLAMLKGQIEVHNAVNSKMDKMMALVGKSERAKGRLEGLAAEKISSATQDVVDENKGR